MTLVEGLPLVEPVSIAGPDGKLRPTAIVRLTLPCTKNRIAEARDYALNREQLTQLVAQGIDTLDAMDEAQAETASNVLPLFAHKASA